MIFFFLFLTPPRAQRSHVSRRQIRQLTRSDEANGRSSCPEGTSPPVSPQDAAFAAAAARSLTSAAACCSSAKVWQGFFFGGGGF